MNRTNLTLTGVLILFLASGCSNQTAAKVGHRIGIVIGKPLGVVAASVDQAVRTTGKIVAENVRQQRHKKATELTSRNTPTEAEPGEKLEQAAKEPPPEQTVHSLDPPADTDSEFWQ